MTNIVKPYKNTYDYSYTSGAYATIELLKERPGIVRAVYVHPAYRDRAGLDNLCAEHGIPCVTCDRAFRMVNQKENSYVLGVFEKYTGALAADQPHIVLVNPSDMGNLGTIVRTMAGLNYRDLAVIEPAADVWNPKTVRASMGALFHIRHQRFHSFDGYMERYPDHSLFPFMLTGATAPEEAPSCMPFSLVFGNEAVGLDDRYAELGRGVSVKIPLSGAVDSYNLAVAAGIGAYIFARKNRRIV